MKKKVPKQENSSSSSSEQEAETEEQDDKDVEEEEKTIRVVASHQPKRLLEQVWRLSSANHHLS
jgi:carbamate kinase